MATAGPLNLNADSNIVKQVSDSNEFKNHSSNLTASNNNGSTNATNVQNQNWKSLQELLNMPGASQIHFDEPLPILFPNHSVNLNKTGESLLP